VLTYITACYDKRPVANHQEVLEAVENRAEQIQALVKKTVEIIGQQVLPQLPELPKVSLDTPAGDFGLSMTQLGVGAMLLAAGAMIGVNLSRQK
jgi:hypothetical protein